MNFFDEHLFIKQSILEREESLFLNDIESNVELLARSIEGKSVLVIGGAGTIGASFIKALLPFHPGQLTVVDYNENGLTELTRDLRSSFDHLMPSEYLSYPFDFGSPVFEKLFHQENFDVVACFAAHKHVRSEKDALAIEAMIQNNVFNTKKLLDLAMTKKPKHFFSVSTDKAANPVNVMGASKKLMENLLMAYANEMKVTTARFANVAFSNGSLLYGFNHRIEKQQPISAPKDIKRYFVSPEESGQLCLLACFAANSGEIVFPRLVSGMMKSFSEIAEDYLKVRNLKPQYCETEDEARLTAAKRDSTSEPYPVYFFESDTSGEKSFEEFYTHADKVDLNRFSALGVIERKNTDNLDQQEDIVRKLKDLFNRENLTKKEIVRLLSEYIDDFQHLERGKNLDSKL